MSERQWQKGMLRKKRVMIGGARDDEKGDGVGVMATVDVVAASSTDSKVMEIRGRGKGEKRSGIKKG